MQIQMTGRHVDITDAIREFVEKKFSKLQKHFDHIDSCHVILSVSKGEHKAESTILVPGNEIFAHAEDKNMYAAIDALIDKLDRQILKIKEKKSNHNHQKPVINSDED